MTNDLRKMTELVRAAVAAQHALWEAVHELQTGTPLKVADDDIYHIAAAMDVRDIDEAYVRERFGLEEQ